MKALTPYELDESMASGDLYQISVPPDFYNKIVKIAMKHNMTFTEFMAKAIGSYIEHLNQK